MSARYLVAVKDRLYCDASDSPRRRRTQTVMRQIAELLCRVLEPIVPHTADEAYRSLHGEDGCVHTAMPLDLAGNADESWPAVMTMHTAALKAIEEAKERGVENPLDAGLVMPDPDGVGVRFTEDFADLCGVSRARFDAAVNTVEVDDLRESPRCERSRKRDETVKERSDGTLLSDRDAQAIGL